MTLPTPVLPEGRVIRLPGRGETFVRVGPIRPGAATVVLLHGWLATADLNWFGTYETISSRYNLLAIDHRGHGRGIRSPHPFALEAAADDLADVLRVLGTGPVIAVGYSMGGPIGLHLAERHPELVSGLVLTATALEWRDSLLDRLRWRGLWLIAATLRRAGDTWAVIRLVDELAATDDLVAAWREHLVGEAKRLDVNDALGAGRALSRFDARPFASRLDVPAAVVITTADRIVRPARQRALAHALAARVFEFEADHDVFLRRAAAFGTAITAAVDAVEARVARPGMPAPRNRDLPAARGPLPWLRARRNGHDASSPTHSTT